MKFTLARPIKAVDDHLKLLANTEVLVQEKLNGWRACIGITATGEVQAWSRSGKRLQIEDRIVRSVEGLPHDTWLDGELLDTGYHIFDILTVAGEDTRKLSLKKRYVLVRATPWPRGLYSVPGDMGLLRDLAHLLHPQKDGQEGVVIKPLAGTYGAPWYKRKFVKHCTAILTATEGESADIALYHSSGGLVPVCGLKVPPGLPLGTLVEVEYLRVSDDLRLVEPIFKGVRDDVERRDCTLSQLEISPERSLSCPALVP